jgi:hypothetical protein
MPFDTAQQILLAPYSLDDKRLQKVFGEIMTHRSITPTCISSTAAASRGASKRAS